MKIAEEIIEKLYKKYGANSDYLFCIPKSSVKLIVKFTLEEAKC